MTRVWPQAGAGAEAAVARALERATEEDGLGAFWSLDESAPESARRLDRERGSAPLHGVPFAVKDMLDVEGLPTTAGIPGRDEPARRDSELVARLRRAGAVPIGKTAMDQLGLTTSGQAAGFPACLNPLDPALSPGGSSSGSAVAVAAGIVPVALGTDTAGSVRVPAAYCGVAAVKPAPRRLSRRGMVSAMGPWDVPGVIAGTVAQCAAALRALGGLSRRAAGGGALRVGVLEDMLGRAEPEVAARCERAAARLGPGFDVERVRLDFDARGFGTVLAAEFERRWGGRVDRRPELFEEAARETVRRARARSVEDVAAARARLADEAERTSARLKRFDALISPTAPVPAPARDRESVEESTRLTRPFNALGWAAASVPGGASGRGAPIGIHVSTAGSRLPEMLAVAGRVELCAREP